MFSRIPGLTAALFLLALLDLGAAGAQEDKKKKPGGFVPSVNMLSIEHVLTNKDPFDTARTKSHAQTFLFHMTKDRPYIIDLRSKEFDAYLRLLSPTGEEIARDDDGGDGSDARLRYKAKVSGPHTIVVTTYSGNQTGRFSLLARDEATIPPEGKGILPKGINVAKLTKNGDFSEAKAELTPNDKTGSPRNACPCRVYPIVLKKDVEVLIDLKSTAFDAYLMLMDKNFRSIANDDDGGEYRNASLRFRPREDGDYFIVALTCTPSEKGPYELRVRPITPADLVFPVGKPLQKDADGFQVRDELKPKEEGLFKTRRKTARAHTLPLEANENVQVDLSSTEFDTVLLVLGPDGREVAFNDDNGETHDSRVIFSAPTKGEYKLIASSVAPGRIGDYFITVKPSKVRPSTPGVGPIKRGDVLKAKNAGKELAKVKDTWEVSDELTPKDPEKALGGKAARFHKIELQANDTVKIDLRSSEFDAHLYITDKDGKLLADDDDGGSGNNSRLIFRAPAKGEYILIAAVHSAGTGKYQLTVEPTKYTPPPLPFPNTPVRIKSDGKELRQEGNVRIVEDKLTAEQDEEFLGGKRAAKYFKIELKPNEIAQIDLKSKAFDAYLLILDSNGRFVARNDNGPEGTDARVTIRASTFRGTTYKIIATTYVQQQYGDFVLTVQPGKAEDVTSSKFFPTPPVQQTGPIGSGPFLNKIEGKAWSKADKLLSVEDKLTEKEVEGKLLGGRAGKVHKLDLKAGENIRIDLMSSDFDAYLLVTDKDGKLLAQNDDGGEGNNSRLIFKAPSAGSYKLIATVCNSGMGSYRMVVQPSDGKPPVPVPPSITLLVKTLGKALVKDGEVWSVADQLTVKEAEAKLSNRPAKFHKVELDADQMVVLDLKSKDFDAFLTVTNDAGRILDEDDDGGEGTDSRLVFRAPAKGMYRFVVSGLDAALGNYTLTIRPAPKEAPKEKAPEKTTEKK